jgi:hypothetical protein
MEREQLLLIIKSALKSLLKYDHVLINQRVKEECINHRFAIYIENAFFSTFVGKDISIDLEYNKLYFDEKQYASPEDERINFRPDLIIHERNTQDFNIVAFELKKDYSNKKDKSTIHGMLKEPFNYLWGVLISYMPNKEYFLVIIYKLEKNEVESFKFKFDKSDLVHQ